MHTFTFHKTVCIGKLHEELVAAVPAAFVVDGRAVGYVEGLPDIAFSDDGVGDGVKLTVPEDADVVTINRVVDEHDATPIQRAEPVDPVVAALEALGDKPITASHLLAILRGDSTINAIRDGVAAADAGGEQ